MIDPQNHLAPPPLAQLCGEGPIALFLDFDGTLVAIASDPDAILVPSDLADRLERLAVRFDGRLALVSGRATDDLKRHLGPLNLAKAGSHGIARFDAKGTVLGAAPEPIQADASTGLEAFCNTHDLRFEGKSHGAALHYRNSPAKRDMARDFVDRLAETFGLTVKSGKGVFELVRPGADKGGAVRAFMQAKPFAGARPIFVGDDVTDDDGFAAARELGGFGIVVGDRKTDAAQYRLADVEGVHAWLTL